MLQAGPMGSLKLISVLHNSLIFSRQDYHNNFNDRQYLAGNWYFVQRCMPVILGTFVEILII